MGEGRAGIVVEAAGIRRAAASMAASIRLMISPLRSPSATRWDRRWPHAEGRKPRWLRYAGQPSGRTTHPFRLPAAAVLLT